jgi:hypothetical protein
MRALALIMIALAMSAAAWGQAQPAVRAEVKPGSVIVGEPVELTVTVLVPTWFTRPPVYPTFELANAITRLPADNSYPIRERVGNESWSGIVRTYEIYPLMGASYRMAGQTMSITFANPGSEAISVDVEVPEVVLRGVVPEGAESLDPYLAGRSLELSIDVEGELDGLEAGDAIVLTYRAELDGLPAIFLPPLAPNLEFDGVAVYRDMPEVEDGDTARRTEKLTLVFEAGGEFSVAGQALSFWNTASQSIETATAEGLVVSVQGPPVAVMVDGESTKNRWQQSVAIVVAVIALILLIWRSAPTLIRRYREVAEQRRQTEDHAFRRLLSALGSGDSAASYRALVHWVERLEPGLGVRGFVARFGDDALFESIAALSAALYGDADGSADLRQLRRQLKAARGRSLQGNIVSDASRLPPLNP